MTRVRLLAALLAPALLTGCGLPLASGVQEPGRVAADSVADAGTQLLPPPPPADATAREIVDGFLTAQSSPADRHEIARQYLHPEVRDTWDDRRGADVYEGVTITAVDETTVAVEYDLLAHISPTGAWTLDESPRPRTETYRLARDDDGELRLVDVPQGLRLTRPGVARSFDRHDVQFVRDADAPLGFRLVPDPTFLPVDADPADVLVRRLLAGPSPAIAGAVTTGFPTGVTLASPVETTDGVVTVNLGGTAGRATPEQLRQLSAQLVWTLIGGPRAYSGVRVLVDGQRIPVAGLDGIQEREDWDELDPNLALDTSALYVENRRLRRLDRPLPSSDVTTGALPVDDVAMSPRTKRLGVLTETPDGGELRTGPLSGPFSLVATRGSVTSLSWGSGEDGLFLTAGGRALLVPGGTGSRVVPVTVSAPPGAGRLSVLRVSRDGARAAAVFGTGEERQVYVGRVERSGDEVSIAGFRAVAPEVTDVADVAWDSSTSVVALGALETTNRLPVRVDVDGWDVAPVRTPGLDGVPESVAAGPGVPLVVSAAIGDRAVLLTDSGGLFRSAGPGTAPAYPG